jgi:hypothetical protein
MADDWDTWVIGVLGGIAAPVTRANIETLWAWSNAESGTDVWRWRNPLNTTEKFGNSFDSGAQPGSRDVQVYSSVQDGIDATILTLGNSYYPVILANLDGSVPRQSWSNACANLQTWGTGCGWIFSAYGAYPGTLGEDMLQTDKEGLVQLTFMSCMGHSAPTEADIAAGVAQIDISLRGYVENVYNDPRSVAYRAHLATVGAAGPPGPTGPAGPPGTVPVHDHVLTGFTGKT